MFCKKCGHENEDDGMYCENCGANLSSTNSSSSSSTSSGLGKTNKILIVAVVVLILGIGVVAGTLLISKAPVVNNTTNNTTVSLTNSGTNSTNSPNTGPKLIDSGSTNGMDSADGYFSFEWNTYEVNENELIIYSTYSTSNRKVKQTNTLKKYDDMRVEINVEPKASGKMGYDTVTTMYGANTVVNYYWNHLRSNVLMKGPIR